MQHVAAPRSTWPKRQSCGRTRTPGTFELARVMGTSPEMIERTYGHLVQGAEDAFRTRLDAFAASRVGVELASAESGMSR